MKIYGRDNSLSSKDFLKTKGMGNSTSVDDIKVIGEVQERESVKKQRKDKTLREDDFNNFDF